MRIAFIMPGFSLLPIGGYRTVYRYANHLVSRGHEVVILYPDSIFSCPKELKRKTWHYGKYLWKKLFCKHKTDWYSLNRNVKEQYVFRADWRFVPKADIYVATFISTSVCLRDYPIPEQNKFYYIQDLENWFGISEEDVMATYRFPMQKIVISQWLLDLVKSTGEDAVLIRNGLEHEEFYFEIPIRERHKTNLLFYYHSEYRKGCDLTLAALEKVRQEIPDLKITAFGFPEKTDLPDYIEYHHQPTRDQLRKLYNDAAIFTAASREEGFGLTVGEAMCCGCAVACSEAKGFKEMAIDEKTALLFPIEDVQKQADCILRLIKDEKLRYNISENAMEYMREFTWDKAESLFEQTLLWEK